jgi:hypothetical protein
MGDAVAGQCTINARATVAGASGKPVKLTQAVTLNR